MLIAVGDKWDRITSWGVLTTSLDGRVWSANPINPFNSRGSLKGVTVSPTNTVVIGDGGAVACSNDLITWSPSKIWFGNFQPLAIKYSTDSLGNFGAFMIAGQGKFLHGEGPYGALAESAQIFYSESGDTDTWEMIYSNPNSQDSRFYGIKRITVPIDMWIAVGSADNKPFAVYSTNQGQNWSSINFPSVTGVHYAYDVVYNDNRYWFTVNGMVWSTPSVINPVWDASAFIVPTYGKADMKQIAVDPVGKHMVAVCSGGIVYTIDLNTWNIISIPGYRFRSITYYNGLWIAGAESNLTTYTYWYSNDGVNWTPDNNQVQIYDFAQI